MLANNPAIAPLGEAKPNTEVFRLLAQRMGFDGAVLPRVSDEDIARQALLRVTIAHAARHRLGTR